MSRIYLEQDIQSLSEFRAGVAEYEAMQEKIELLKEMRAAEAHLATGLGVSNDDARSQILGRINK